MLKVISSENSIQSVEVSPEAASIKPVKFYDFFVESSTPCVAFIRPRPTYKECSSTVKLHVTSADTHRWSSEILIYFTRRLCDKGISFPVGPRLGCIKEWCWLLNETKLKIWDNGPELEEGIFLDARVLTLKQSLRDTCEVVGRNEGLDYCTLLPVKRGYSQVNVMSTIELGGEQFMSSNRASSSNTIQRKGIERNHTQKTGLVTRLRKSLCGCENCENRAVLSLHNFQVTSKPSSSHLPFFELEPLHLSLISRIIEVCSWIILLKIY
ncbi:hypothetical protein PIB30_067384 [Stylosanthes scabra]|uniref:Uncharacterized protein n=1 Tax=Stylosanthes scabra TaxID=79078 RepID=A0ABU6WMH7_9FABA|nr:hypothetical protein [Stylosanthes scabra]